jgi:hypothetical protein
MADLTASEKIEQFRESKRKMKRKESTAQLDGLAHYETWGGPDGGELSDAFGLVLERLDEARQFAIDEFLQGPDPEALSVTQSLQHDLKGLEHLERECFLTAIELYHLVNSIRESATSLKFIELGNNAKSGVQPDTRPKFRKTRLKRPTKKKRS